MAQFIHKSVNRCARLVARENVIDAAYVPGVGRPAAAREIVVRTAGVEPARISPRDFKSLASTGSATSASIRFSKLPGKRSTGRRQISVRRPGPWKAEVAARRSSRFAGIAFLQRPRADLELHGDLGQPLTLEAGALQFLIGGEA